MSSDPTRPVPPEPPGPPRPPGPDGAAAARPGPSDSGSGSGRRPGKDPLLIAVAVAAAVLLLVLLYLALRGGEDEVVLEGRTDEPSPTPTPTATEPTPTPTPTPTATAAPTGTPTPAATATAPTPTPEPDVTATPPAPPTVEPTQPEPPAPEEEPFVLSGEGAQDGGTFTHPGGVAVITFQQDDGESFALSITPPGGGEPQELVAATSVPRGQRAVALEPGEHRLSVVASGAWDLEITLAVPTAGARLPLTIEGSDEFVTEPIELDGAELLLEFAHENGGEAEIRVLRDDGEELAAFTVGPGEQVPVPLRAGLYVVEVRSAGVWRLILG